MELSVFVFVISFVFVFVLDYSQYQTRELEEREMYFSEQLHLLEMGVRISGCSSSYISIYLIYPYISYISIYQVYPYILYTQWPYSKYLLAVSIKCNGSISPKVGGERGLGF